MKPILHSFSSKTEDGLLRKHTARFDNELGHGRFAVIESAFKNVQQAKNSMSGKATQTTMASQAIRIVDANNNPNNAYSETVTWVEPTSPEAVNPAIDDTDAIAVARARVAEVQAQSDGADSQSNFDLAA